MAVLWNRAGHYILSCGFFFLPFYLSFFLACSQPSQIGCLPYFHTWCGLSANLRCRSETCCTRLAEYTERKKSPKFPICAPSRKPVGLYLRNWDTYWQSEKLLKSNISPHVVTIWWTSAH